MQVGVDLFVFTEYPPLRVTKLAEGCPSKQTYLAPAHKNLNGYSLALHQRKAIYLTGGFSRTKVSAEVLTYDLNLNSWNEKPGLNEARCDHASCVLSNSLFVFAGQSNSDSRNTVECLNLDKTTSKQHKWELFRV